MKKSAFFRMKQPYLPQFSRIFTVRPIFWVVSGLAAGILASFILWNHPFAGDKTPNQNIIEKTTNSHLASAQRSYEEWKRIMEHRPDYRDGYVMLAWYARELGKHDEATLYVQKALTLDPNYKIPEILEAAR